MRRTPKFFFLVALLASAVFTQAQYEDSTFIRYTSKDGLSDNYVTAIAQDDWGFLWIGTDNGLNRFDGFAFKKFYQGTPSLPLPSNTIWRLKSFGDHQLGIITLRGFQVLDTKHFSVTNYRVPDSTAFSTYRNYTLDALPLPDHSFALATATGFYTFNKDGRLLFQYEKYKAADVGKKRILFARRIIPLNSKEYIIYTDDTLFCYNTGSNSFHPLGTLNDGKSFYNPPETQIGYWIDQLQISATQYIFLQQKQERIIFYDRSRDLVTASPLPFKLDDEINWLTRISQLDDSTFAFNSMHSGFFVFHLDKQTGQIRFEPKRYLPGYRISCLFVDRDGKLWVGTRKGILYQKRTVPFIKSYHYPVASPDNETNGFSDALRYKNKLYLARHSPYNGLVIVDTGSMKLETRIRFYNGNDLWNEVYSIAMYQPDTLWLGTSSGPLWFDTKTYHYGKLLDERKYPPSYFDEIYFNKPDALGNGWFCYILGGIVGRYHLPDRSFTFFTPQTKPALPFEKTKMIVTDSYGDTWIGGHALARWNEHRQTFDTLIRSYAGVNKYNDDILACSADNNGSLWIHNTDNGLLEYRIRAKTFAAYSMQNGLPSAQIRCMSPVINNILWLGGVNYLAAFNTSTKKIAVVYDYRDGLPEEFSSSRKIYYDEENDRCYLFSGDYLSIFPGRLPAAPTSPIDILLPELLINNKRSIFFPGDTVSLAHRENSLSLQFTAVNFESPEHYRFEYRINDGQWAPLGGQRTINLDQLQDGHYLVTTRVIGKFGKEKTKELLIIIRPPFWKTTWFLLSALLAAALIVWSAYRYRVQQVRRRANIDKQLAETEMKVLHAQMNPHFVFNSLNSIREMILSNENKDASRYLGKFAQLIRLTLVQSSQSFIPLRQTIDYLERYIEMEMIRNTHFNASITVDDQLDTDEALLPPMLVQPFVENAIWHAAGGEPRDIDITISFSKKKGHLVCIIDDNGVGIEHAQSLGQQQEDLHASVGITNVQNRIRLLNEKHGLESSVVIIDKKHLEEAGQTGTCITIYLPLEINAPQ
jgi:ligand-binding sensor domain-containing protein